MIPLSGQGSGPAYLSFGLACKIKALIHNIEHIRLFWCAQNRQGAKSAKDMMKRVERRGDRGAHGLCTVVLMFMKRLSR